MVKIWLAKANAPTLEYYVVIRIGHEYLMKRVYNLIITKLNHNCRT